MIPVELVIAEPITCEVCARSVPRGFRVHDGRGVCGRCWQPLQGETRRRQADRRRPARSVRRCAVCDRVRRGNLREYHLETGEAGLVCRHPPCLAEIERRGAVVYAKPADRSTLPLAQVRN